MVQKWYKNMLNEKLLKYLRKSENVHKKQNSHFYQKMSSVVDPTVGGAIAKENNLSQHDS